MAFGRYFVSRGSLEVYSSVDDSPNERVIYECHGYSGRGECRDTPGPCQWKAGFGPLPCGFYRVVHFVRHSRLGADAFQLQPFSTNVMFGRSGFWIHGDSRLHPGQSSHGCIVLPETSRAALAEYRLTRLEVVP